MYSLYLLGLPLDPENLGITALQKPEDFYPPPRRYTPQLLEVKLPCKLRDVEWSCSPIWTDF
jgi:hypothetical protein